MAQNISSFVSGETSKKNGPVAINQVFETDENKNQFRVLQRLTKISAGSKNNSLEAYIFKTRLRVRFKK
jgi:hypothetical protein